MTDDPCQGRPTIGLAAVRVDHCPACDDPVTTDGYCAACREGGRAERHAGIHPGYVVESEDEDDV